MGIFTAIWRIKLAKHKANWRQKTNNVTMRHTTTHRKVLIILKYFGKKHFEGLIQVTAAIHAGFYIPGNFTILTNIL